MSSLRGEVRGTSPAAARPRLRGGLGLHLFFTDYNLLAAGSVLVALPTILVFLLLRRHFIAGLTLGASRS